MPRIVILGGPQVGKSTLSRKLKDELAISTLRTSDDIKHLGWSEASAEASKWFSESGDWICEGVQMARALRKWLLANPNVPLDVDILKLDKPFAALKTGQESMAKGVETVFGDIEQELLRRGARIHKVPEVDNAIKIFQRDAEENQKARRLMALPKGYTKAEWEALPEAKRKLYEDEGLYVADGENWKFSGLDEADGVTKALAKERETVATLKKSLQELTEKVGTLDLDAAREAMQQREEAELDANKKKGDIQAILDAANKKFDAERAQLKTLIQEKEDLLGKKESVIQSIVLDQALTTAIAKHKGVPEILLPVIKAKGEVRAILENGSDVYVPRVFDKDGNVVFGDTKGNPMDPDQYVATLKENATYARAFDAAGTGGMGAYNPQGAGQGNGKVIRLNKDEIKTNNQLYVQAKAEAAKTGATIEFVESTH